MSAPKKLKLSNTVSDNDSEFVMGNFSDILSTRGNLTPENKTNTSSIGLKELKLKANQFLNAEKKDADALIWIVAMAKKAMADKRVKIVDGAIFLKVLFTNILKTVHIPPLPPHTPLELLPQQPTPQQAPPRFPMQHPPPQQTPPQQPPPSALQKDVEDENSSYEHEFRIQLEIVYRFLQSQFVTKVMADASACLEAVMTILFAESTNPGAGRRVGFPVSRFCSVLESLLSTRVMAPPSIVMFKDYTKNIDILHFTWKLLPSFINSQKFNNVVYSYNLLALVRSSNPKDRATKDDHYWCYDFRDNYKTEHITKNINSVWEMLLQAVIKIDMNVCLHRQLLLALNEVFIDYLDNPLVLTDFLMDSMEAGGAISLLSLHGIYVLMQTQNVSFPDIYKKLYCMFEPKVFVSKYKARLFYLTDLFLSSTHLPEALVAAFVKRLARLTLTSKPKDILVILCFIRILVQRHPSLKNLVIAKIPKEVRKDTYIMKETEPTESGALSSFLWEIDLLKQNALPKINNAARALFALTPIEDSELAELLDKQELETFDAITKSVVQKISMNYNTPNGFHLPEFDKFKRRWDLF